MVFLHLFIVNKSGGLILQRPLLTNATTSSSTSQQQRQHASHPPPRVPKIGTNEWLRIGSTFHSLHAIAAEASPVRLENNKNEYGADDGIEEIVAGGMVLRCFQTRTGVKFVITAEPGTPDIDYVLREIYALYTDCALKDPFYELDMPIRCELFTQAIDLLMARVEKQHASQPPHFHHSQQAHGGGSMASHLRLAR